VVEYVLCAVEYAARKKGEAFSFTDVQACDWIDQIGGMQSLNFISLFNHSGDEAAPVDDEKKTEGS